MAARYNYIVSGRWMRLVPSSTTRYHASNAKDAKRYHNSLVRQEYFYVRTTRKLRKLRKRKRA